MSTYKYILYSLIILPTDVRLYEGNIVSASRIQVLTRGNEMSSCEIKSKHIIVTVLSYRAKM